MSARQFWQGGAGGILAPMDSGRHLHRLNALVVGVAVGAVAELAVVVGAPAEGFAGGGKCAAVVAAGGDAVGFSEQRNRERCGAVAHRRGSAELAAFVGAPAI